MLDEVTAEAKRRGLDAAEAIKFDAGRDVEDLFDAVKKVVPTIENSIFKNEEGVLDAIQEIMQPIPGKKAANIKPENLPGLIESKSGLKNNARKLLEFKETEDGFRKLINKEGPDGLFIKDDYEIIKGGKLDQFLKNIESSVGRNKGRVVAKEFEDIIIKMRNNVDNMTGKILNKNLQKEMSIKLQNEIGNYLTADYRHFDQSIFPFFRNASANAQKQEALRYYKAAKLKQESAKLGIPVSELEKNVNLINKIQKDGEKLITKYLSAKSIDDVDAIRAGQAQEILSGKPKTPSGKIDKAANKLEDQVIKVNPEILRSKKLNEFEEIIFGRIKDPKHTYLSSITKMASLNSTLDFMEDVGRIGSKKFFKRWHHFKPW